MISTGIGFVLRSLAKTLMKCFVFLRHVHGHNGHAFSEDVVFRTTHLLFHLQRVVFLLQK